MSFEKFNLVADDGICTIMNRKLHRYQKIDANFLDSLKYNYLWFSDPENFNDPFDCKMYFDFENTPEEIEAFGREINETPENAYRKMNESQLSTRVKELITNPEIFYKGDFDQNIEEIKKIGVCCFSESDSKLLMWSHYGDKHQGACLTFDAGCDKDLFLVYSFCVEYLTKFPKINWIKDRGKFKLRRFAFATKSFEWSYEEEVRVIRDDRLSPYRGKVKFDKKSLMAIKFGYKSTIDNRLEVINALDKIGDYDHVRFYLAKLKKFDFGIEYEEIVK